MGDDKDEQKKTDSKSEQTFQEILYRIVRVPKEEMEKRMEIPKDRDAESEE